MQIRNYSQSSDNNKAAIAERLIDCIGAARRLLEIGSGSGQHALYLAPKLPRLSWCPTELPDRLAALHDNIIDAGVQNIQAPRVLNVNHPNWGMPAVDVVFTANTLHIMSWASVVSFINGVGNVFDMPSDIPLNTQKVLCIYGPFKYDGAFTTPSNQAFDEHLRLSNVASGIRDFEAVDELAQQQGLQLWHDFAMPANNQLLVWRR